MSGFRGLDVKDLTIIYDDDYKKSSVIYIGSDIKRAYDHIIEQIERDEWTDAAITYDMEYEYGHRT